MTCPTCKGIAFDDPWSSGLIDIPTQEAIRNAIGPVVRQIRLERGMSQTELAKRCDFHLSTESRIEWGQRPIGLMVVFRICAVLGIRISDVLRMAEDIAVPLRPCRDPYHRSFSRE